MRRRKLIEAIGVIGAVGLLGAFALLHGVMPSAVAQAKSQEAVSYEKLTETTPAYRDAAYKFLLSEANEAARRLQLDETIPITDTNVVEVYLSPPRLAKSTGAIGNLKTRKYIYCVARGHKLSYVLKNFGDGPANTTRDYDELQSAYTWPLTKLDTNRATELARKWLDVVSVDLALLDRNGVLEVRAWTPGKSLVPLYWVVWRQGETNLASVELFEPTASLRQLRVEDAKFLRRESFPRTNFSLVDIESSTPPIRQPREK
ncbi:MAG: hypothetical protein JNK85_28060 [Verrucomicrobiales bacterium]|nr:hypothetical protein [Verrucomicrobiales bacterium]